MSVSTHATAAIRVANQKKSIFNSLTLSHRGTQAFLRSNRLTPFLWLWCPFCISSRTTMAKEKEKKKKGHEYVGAAQPTAGGSLNHHKQRKGRFWHLINMSLEEDQWIPASTVQLTSPLSGMLSLKGCYNFNKDDSAFKLNWLANTSRSLTFLSPQGAKLKCCLQVYPPQQLSALKTSWKTAWKEGMSVSVQDFGFKATEPRE